MHRNSVIVRKQFYEIKVTGNSRTDIVQYVYFVYFFYNDPQNNYYEFKNT